MTWNPNEESYGSYQYRQENDKYLQYIPKKFANYLNSDRVIATYYDTIHLQVRHLNMTDMFNQMCTGSRLNLIKSIYGKLLTDEERSMFLTDIGVKV